MEEPIAERGWLIFGAKLKGWKQLFHIFHFSQSDMALESNSPFLCILKAVYSERRFPTSEQ